MWISCTDYISDIVLKNVLALWVGNVIARSPALRNSCLFNLFYELACDGVYEVHDQGVSLAWGQQTQGTEKGSAAYEFWKTNSNGELKKERPSTFLQYYRQVFVSIWRYMILLMVKTLQSYIFAVHNLSRSKGCRDIPAHDHRQTESTHTRGQQIPRHAHFRA